MTSRVLLKARFWGAAAVALVALGVRPSLGANPGCIEAWGEARYRNFGYDHIVHVRNRCDRPALCDVSTDVSPEPNRVTVGAAEEIEVLTFRGSPAREFKARAECQLAH